MACRGFQNLLREFGSIGERDLVVASQRLMLPLPLVQHWASRCEQPGLMICCVCAPPSVMVVLGRIGTRAKRL